LIKSFKIIDGSTGKPERISIVRSILENVLIVSYSHKTKRIYVTKDADGCNVMTSPETYNIKYDKTNRGNVTDLKATIDQKKLIVTFDNGSILMF